MRQNSEVLFHQSTVDYMADPTDLSRASIAPASESLHPRTDEEMLALNAFKRVIELKSTLGTLPDRVHDLSQGSSDTTYITAKRRGAFELARQLAEKATATGLAVSWHGLADVKNFVAAGVPLDSLPIIRSVREDTMHIVRLEEALALRAEHLIGDMRTRGASEDGRLAVDGDHFAVHLNSGRTKHIPLHGYRFNRTNKEGAGPSEFIRDLPSCEVFIAATVLEQVNLLPAVVRVIPYWMKDREIAARDMLRLVGYDDLPVVSIIAGEHGDIEKSLPWTRQLPPALAALSPVMKERIAHRASGQIAKKVHDAIFSEQRELFERYCRPEFKANLPPAALLKYPFISQRAHEFTSRTLPAATLYEETKITTEKAGDVYSNILVLSEVLSANYQRSPLMYPEPVCEVTKHEGQNTNDVTYVRLVLAARPEEDPALLPHFPQIDLVGHFTFENLPPETVAGYERARNPRQYFVSNFLAHPPRTALLEARRVGPGFTRYTNTK